MKKRLIAYTHGRDDPAARFRIGQYAACLREAGWNLSLRPLHPERPRRSHVRNKYARRVHQAWGVSRRRLRRLWDIQAAAHYDVAFVNRDLLENRNFYMQRLLARNARVIFDFDDAIFLGQKADHIEWVCRHAAWVTAGNEHLADFARQFTDQVTVLPTVVDTDAYRTRRTAESRPLRVGWLGSDLSIRETLFPYASMLARLQAELGFEFVVVSKPRPPIPECGLQWTYHEWSPEAETNIADLFDIGIMPLTDEPYQQGKCGCKLLQYMAAGLPAIASPVGINAAVLGDGTRGLPASSEADWRTPLSRLVSDPTLRQQLGAKGRAFVEKEYSIKRWFPILLDILVKVDALPR